MGKVRWTTLLAACAAMTAAPAIAAQGPYYFGVDLSYVNEMDDCGAVYKAGGAKVEPYKFFQSRGSNLARIRLWNDPDWTNYSNLPDVKRSLARAKAAGLQTLLDLHYSDDWADGEKQLAPKAWAGLSAEDQVTALYKFTYDTLIELDKAGLAPDQVQVGNETNGEIVSSLARAKEPINWTRNAALFNAGIRAVRDAGAKMATKPKVMLHIAQPENVEPWFEAATKAGVTDYDLIGISYYRKWSTRSLSELGLTINRMRIRYPQAQVVVVETAYPFTTASKDSMPNLLGADTLIAGYPATPEGQKKYLTDLTQLVIAAGGAGVVYWEPAWISTGCKTRWGTGSSWENAALFDLNGEALPGADWPLHPYVYPVDVEFRVKAQAGEGPLYLDADFLTGAGPVAMTRDGEDWRYTIALMPGSGFVAATATTPQGVAGAEAASGKIGQGASRIRLPTAAR